jgi:hypothetical protein
MMRAGSCCVAAGRRVVEAVDLPRLEASCARPGDDRWWNLSVVAVTAELIGATSPNERGRVLGFDDPDLPPRQRHTITTRRAWYAFETALEARIADAAITATAQT